jgi:nitrate ABC transporter ATP-binding subunit
MNKYLEISRLSKSYDTPDGAAVIVRDFDLSIAKGEFVCLIGHSGCGKSTVLSIVAGLNSLSSGGIFLNGREIQGAGTDRGVVFQAPCLLPWKTALENVLLGVEQVFRKATSRTRVEIATRHLQKVGLGQVLHKRPCELSAGMRQRVGIARAFAHNPKILLLDEPFGMLDSLTKFELQQTLIDVWGQNRKTALMVTHDVDEALFLSDRIAMMTRGPEARVGGILEIPFPRPRRRVKVIEDPRYDLLRERLISFLDDEEAISVPSPSRPPQCEQRPAERALVAEIS